MLFRKILLVAAVASPLALSPAPVAAQERGTDRAATATAQADAVAAGTKGRAAKRPTAVPSGIARNFPGQTLPPGIRRTRPAPAPAPAPEPAPEPAPAPAPTPAPDDGCTAELVFVDGAFVLIDCNGNVVDPLNPGGAT